MTDALGETCSCGLGQLENPGAVGSSQSSEYNKGRML